MWVKDMEKENQEGEGAFTLKGAMKEASLWIDQEQKIASFHEMDGGERKSFQQENTLIDYIDDLVSNGYRFQ
jgi:hypothetical protein